MTGIKTLDIEETGSSNKDAGLKSWSFDFSCLFYERPICAKFLSHRTSLQSSLFRQTFVRSLLSFRAKNRPNLFLLPFEKWIRSKVQTQSPFCTRSSTFFHTYRFYLYKRTPSLPIFFCGALLRGLGGPPVFTLTGLAFSAPGRGFLRPPCVPKTV